MAVSLVAVGLADLAAGGRRGPEADERGGRSDRVRLLSSSSSRDGNLFVFQYAFRISTEVKEETAHQSSFCRPLVIITR